MEKTKKELKIIKRDQIKNLIIDLIGRLGVVLLLCIFFMNIFPLETLKENPSNIWLNRFIFFSIILWIASPAFDLLFKFIDFIKNKKKK